MSETTETTKATAMNDLPPALARHARDFVPAIMSAVDSKSLLSVTRDVVAHDRWCSFDQFHKSNDAVMRAYQSAGADTELYLVPTGGVRGSGKWIIPEAIDIKSATLQIVSPIKKNLADYQQSPWHIIQWSAATGEQGLTCDLVAIDSEEHLAGLADSDLRGKMVLTKLDVLASRTRFCRAGVAAVLSDRLIAGLPDAVGWTKFGWATIDLPLGVPPIIGFCISSTQGDELRALLTRHGKLTVHAKVDLRRYEGSHGVVSGLVRGTDPAAGEIWAVAHCAEPGALDNTSGVSACVGIAGALSRLIENGTLPRPRRTIRLVHAFECYGFFHYYEHHPRSAPPLAGVCVDTIGARPDLCKGQLRWHATCPASASFADDIGAVFLEAAMKIESAGYELRRMPFVSTEDTLLGDPQYGFPCPWITNHPVIGYHSSGDTIEMMDPKGMTVCTSALAAYLYYLATIDASEAGHIADWYTRGAISQLATTAPNDPPFRDGRLRAQHAASLRQLQRFAAPGEKSPDSSAFEHHAAKLKRDCPAPAAAVPNSSDPRAAAIPRRLLPLAPTPENLWPSQAARWQRGMSKWVHYWADGIRSIAEISILANHTVENVANYFDMLQTLGYVELLPPNA